MASYSAIITAGELILAGGQILILTVSRFVFVSEKKMVSQQILTTVMTHIVVDKSIDLAKLFTHIKTSIQYLFFSQRKQEYQAVIDHELCPSQIYASLKRQP